MECEEQLIQWELQGLCGKCGTSAHMTENHSAPKGVSRKEYFRKYSKTEVARRIAKKYRDSEKGKATFKRNYLIRREREKTFKEMTRLIELGLCPVCGREDHGVERHVKNRKETS